MKVDKDIDGGLDVVWKRTDCTRIITMGIVATVAVDWATAIMDIEWGKT